MARVIKPVRLNLVSRPAMMNLIKLHPELYQELREGSSELARAILTDWASGHQINPKMSKIIEDRVDRFYQAAPIPFKVIERADYDGLESEGKEKL